MAKLRAKYKISSLSLNDDGSTQVAITAVVEAAPDVAKYAYARPAGIITMPLKGSELSGSKLGDTVFVDVDKQASGGWWISNVASAYDVTAPNNVPTSQVVTFYNPTTRVSYSVTVIDAAGFAIVDGKAEYRLAYNLV